MRQSSDFIYFSIFMLDDIWYHNYHNTKSGLNSQEIVILVPIIGPLGLKLNRNKTYDFLQIQSTSGEIMIYVFMQENGETHEIWAFWEFQKKNLLPKIVLGFLETHFMHITVKVAFSLIKHYDKTYSAWQ